MDASDVITLVVIGLFLCGATYGGYKYGYGDAINDAATKVNDPPLKWGACN